MVNFRAVKIAIVIFGFLLVALVAGQVLRRLTWMLTWGLTMAILLALAYGAYEIWSGWTAGEADDQSGRTRESTTSSDSYETVDDAKTAYADDTLSDAEFESELEDIMDADSRELEREYD